jgi:hypothetical protein
VLSFPLRYRTSHFHFDVCSAPNDCKGCKDCKDGSLQPATACYCAAIVLLARTADEASSLLARLPVSVPVCGAGLDHSGPPILHWRCAGCSPPPRFSLAVDSRPSTAEWRASRSWTVHPLNGGGVGSKAAQISLTMGSLLVLLHRYFTPTSYRIASPANRLCLPTLARPFCTCTPPRPRKHQATPPFFFVLCPYLR